MLVPTLIQQATSDTTKVLLINEGQSWLQTWLPNIIPAAVVIILVWVSIKAITKTAEASRVSNIHFEMYKCVYETCEPLSEMIRHLYYVAEGTLSTLDGEVVDSYHEKYMKKIGGLSDEYNTLLVKQDLLLPRKFMDKLRPLSNKIEEANRRAMQMEPRNHKSNMEIEMFQQNKRELLPKVKEIIGLYEELINVARGHIGSHLLKPIGDFSYHNWALQKDN